MKNKISRTIKRVLASMAVAMLVVLAFPTNVFAENPLTYSASQADDPITDDDRSSADAILYNYANSLMIQYDMNSPEYKCINDAFYAAVYYIAYAPMTKSQLSDYVNQAKANIENSVKNITVETVQYVQVADNWKTPCVGYGRTVSIVLPIINLGTEELNDFVIEPEVSTDVTKWPFEPDTTGYVQTEPFIPGYSNMDSAMANRREFTYTFKVRDDVMTGYYPLVFDISYTRAGVRIADDKRQKLTVYVETVGKPESGYIGGNGNEDKVPKSRIIVTGYDTNLEKINSGDNFDLTIHVQNTSAETAVSNILFNVSSQWQDAASSGGSSSSSTITIDPFMPTSGSNSIYIERINPKETKDITISMSSRAGLAQMSYPLYLEMTYDSGNQFDLTDKTSISIPVYQEAKFDTSNMDVVPASINVGSQSNVMFSIYNTGKTSLYNTQVIFEGDSIENNMAFVGNLASGATGNVDIMLTGVSPTMDDGTINITISYEDESGNVSTVEKTCNLYVNEVMMDDYSSNAGMRQPMDEEEETKDHSTLIRGIIIAIIVLAIAAAAFVAYSIAKKKKEAALLQEDLKDLEDLDSNNDSNDDSSNDSTEN